MFLARNSNADSPMLVIYNPTAGRRRAQLLWQVLDLLVHNGVRVDVAQTTRAGDARALAQAAAANQISLVVAAGGDGTIAEVANGLAGSESRLGIIPLGTANVLANEFGLNKPAREVAAALAFGRRRRLWPGRAITSDGCRLFVQMLGVGFDAHVVHRLSPFLKRHLGRGAYVAQTLQELPRYRFQPMLLRLDGKEVQAFSAIVSKGRFYGGRFVLAPAACPGEPGFWVTLFETGGPFSAMLYGAALPFDLLPKTPGVRLYRAAQVEFLGNATLPAQADGDAAGPAPLCITDAPNPIEVVVGA
jgi:diacylglycerol kinase (ATP)